MIDRNHPVVQALGKQLNDQPVQAVRDGCSQGEPDGVILYGDGKVLCSGMHFAEAKVIADALNLLVEPK